MTIIFYLLLVLFSPVKFSWLWLFIAFLIQFLEFISRAEREYMLYQNSNKNYWKGDQ